MPFKLYYREKYIRKGLDRVVATQAWHMRLPTFTVLNHDHINSHHRPVIIDTHERSWRRQGSAWGLVPRFQFRWLEEDECRGIVGEWMTEGVAKNKKGVMAAVKWVLGELVDRNVLVDLEKKIGWRTEKKEYCKRKKEKRRATSVQIE